MLRHFAPTLNVACMGRQLTPAHRRFSHLARCDSRSLQCAGRCFPAGSHRSYTTVKCRPANARWMTNRTAQCGRGGCGFRMSDCQQFPDRSRGGIVSANDSHIRIYLPHSIELVIRFLPTEGYGQISLQYPPAAPELPRTLLASTVASVSLAAWDGGPV